MLLCEQALRLIVRSAALANTIFFFIIIYVYKLSFSISVISSGFKSI